MVRPRLVLLAALLAALAGLSPAGAAVAWLSSVEDGLARARAEKRLLFLEIASARVPAGAARDREIYANPRLTAILEAFVTVRLDADKHAAAAAKYEPVGYPTLIVLQADGKEIARPPGTLDGEALADRLLKILEDERALITLREKLALNPDDLPSQIALARLALTRGDLETARPAIEKLSRAADEEIRVALPGLWMSLGILLGKGAPTKKGQEWFERVTREFPQAREAALAHYYLGLIHTMEGNRDAAARALEKAVAAAQDDYLRERARNALKRLRDRR